MRSPGSFLFFLLLSVPLLAQDSLSLSFKLSHITYGTNDDLLFFGSNRAMDSSLGRAWQYNSQHRRGADFQDLGSPGSPQKSLRFNGLNTTGLDLGIHYLDDYFMDAGSVKFYQAGVPYTDARYSQGGNKLIFLNLTHTQNLRRNLNMGVDFQRLKHDGYYLRQAPSFYNTRVFAHYYGKKYGRYHALAAATFNHATVQESGGFVNDTIFEEVEAPVPVRLRSAQSKVRNGAYSLSQYYRFGSKGKTVIAVDPENNRYDTLNTFKPRWQVFNRLEVQRNRYMYSSTGPDTLMYDVFLRDSFLTNDSVYQGKVSSEQGLAFRLDAGRGGALTAVVSSLLEWNRIFQHYDITANNRNVGFRANIGLQKGQGDSITYLAKIDAVFYTMGYNGGDYKLGFTARHYSRHFYTGLDLFSQQYTQPFLYRYFGSNHYFRNTPLDPTLVRFVKGTIGARKKDWLLSLCWQDVKNYTYFDTAAQVRQLNDHMQVLQAVAEGTLELGRFFRLYNQLVFQYTPDDDVLRLPRLCSRNTFYYERGLRKRPLIYMAGIDVTYRTAWTADGWDPAARAFILQNQVSIGNYPQLDVWLAGKIRNFNLSLKFEHANQGLMGTRYYTTPHYALWPRIFRLGFQWRLF